MLHSKHLLKEINVSAVLFRAGFSTCDISKHLSCDTVSAWNVTSPPSPCVYSRCKIMRLNFTLTQSNVHFLFSLMPNDQYLIFFLLLALIFAYLTSNLPNE